MAKTTHRWDVFRLLTSYQLFSRTTHNYKLYYRDKSIEGTETTWEDISLFIPYRHSHAFWFPQRQVNESINSIMDDLATLIKKERNKSKLIKDGFIYQQILRFIKRQPAQFDDNAQRQFKISELRMQDHTEQDIYISDFHQL